MSYYHNALQPGLCDSLNAVQLVLKQPLLRLIATDCSNNNRNISADIRASVKDPERSRQPAQLPLCARDSKRRGLMNFGTRLVAVGFSPRSRGFSPR